MAVAVIAAALADPLVELASNLGLFGRGNFTDRSNLDVFPAVIFGLALLVLYLIRKSPALAMGRALPRGVASLLPSIFALQLLTLFIMESLEQILVRGHFLGPTVWLGGPLACSLAIHAAFCLAITLWLARSMGRLAATTLRVLRLIRALVTFDIRRGPVVVRRRNAPLFLRRPVAVASRIGERAPPLALI